MNDCRKLLETLPRDGAKTVLYKEAEKLLQMVEESPGAKVAIAGQYGRLHDLVENFSRTLILRPSEAEVYKRFLICISKVF